MLIIRDDDYIRLNYLSDFIEEFVEPSHKPRLHYLLSKPKRRHEIGGHFHNSAYLDSRYTHHIRRSDQSVNRIHRLMVTLGASSSCFVFTAGSLGFEGDLKDALEEYVGTFVDMILYCRTAKIGYYQSHDGDSYILSKSNMKLTRDGE